MVTDLSSTCIPRSSIVAPLQVPTGDTPNLSGFGPIRPRGFTNVVVPTKARLSILYLFLFSPNSEREPQRWTTNPPLSFPAQHRRRRSQWIQVTSQHPNPFVIRPSPQPRQPKQPNQNGPPLRRTHRLFHESHRQPDLYSNLTALLLQPVLDGQGRTAITTSAHRELAARAAILPRQPHNKEHYLL
jgi:hypothetical protein